MLIYASYTPHIPSPLGPRNNSSLMDAEYTSSKPHRVSVKQRSPPHQLWRDRFKQQCLTRIKESRDSLINSRRLGLMVADNTPIEVVEDEEKVLVGHLLIFYAALQLCEDFSE
ncbi:hypothetical protein BC938DRAFT_479825 [Jimgerdemannia flammicorona]|uniref:RPA-interacting protein N-terminal domain-containing protein n=1 Tax=Jimgerdemannia flammicorona TaxID=994334 RepID=A0A433QK25_9FUNG|nr:hypothetical protein BC938DRAFT_479825 [Jimgerdemannia flammicorona]